MEKLGEAVLEVKADLRKLEKGFKAAERDSGRSASRIEGDFEKAAAGMEAGVKEAGAGMERSLSGTRTSGQRDADRMAGAFDDAGSKMSSSVREGTDDMERDLGGLSAKGKVAAGAIAAAFGGQQLAEAFDDSATASGRLQARLGLNEKRVKAFDRFATRVYVDNFGESMTDAADKVGLVHQALGLQGRALGNTTERVFALSDAFEDQGAEAQIVTEAVRAVKGAYPGMGEKKILDQITYAFQQGAGTAGDLQDTLQEYPSHFKAIGLNSRDMMSWLTIGMNKGARNTDLLADAVKEFGIEVQLEGGKAQVAIEKMFGPEKADQLIRDFSRGGEAGRDAFYAVMRQLSKTSNEQDRYNLAAQLFATKGEDMVGVLDRMAPAFLRSRNASDEARGAARKLDEQYGGIGHAIEGIKRKVLTELAPSMKRVNQIMKSDVSGEQKFDRILDEIGKLADKALPRIGEVGGRLGVRLVRAMAKGFVESDLLGKLFIGGAALRLFGGRGALLALGGRMGKLMGGRMGRVAGPAFALAFVTLGLSDPKIRRLVARGAKQLGEIFVNAFIGVVNTGIRKINKSLDAANIAAFAGVDAPNLGEIGEVDFTPWNDAGKAIKRVSVPLKKLWGDIGKTKNELGGLNRNAGKNLGDTADHFDKPRRAADRTEQGVRRHLRRFGAELKDTSKTTKRQTSKVEGSFKGASNKVNSATGRMSRNVGELSINTWGGFKNIRKNLDRSLGAVGAKKHQWSLVKGKIDKVTSGWGTGGFQAGGVSMVPGHGTGDKVPAVARNGTGFINSKAAKVMLEPGELKVEPETVAKMGGPPVIHAINKIFPRFQEGGSVPGFAAGGVAQPPGDPGSEVVQGAYAGAVGSFLRRWGMDLTQGYNPGGPSVSPGHLSLSAAPSLDVVPLNGDWGGSFLSGLKWAVRQGWNVLYGSRGVGTALANHGEGNHAHIDWGGGTAGGKMAQIARVLLKGPDGPLKDTGQGALDKSWKAAKAYLAKQMPKEGSEGVMRGSGEVEKVFAQVARKKSRSKTATMALGMAGYAESGMRDLAGGDGTSQGALQLLSSTAAGLGVSPHDEAAIASIFFDRGYYGRGGANMLADKGLPAHLVAQNVQGSADSSGSNYARQKGPASAWMRRYGLQEGGIVGRAVGLGSGLFPGFAKGGNIGLNKALIKIGKAKKPKDRFKALKGLKGDIRDIGLPDWLGKRLKNLNLDAETFGQFADRASTLTVDPITEGGDPILGEVGGKTEVQWLHKQLSRLFALRNSLARAQEVMAERVEQQEAVVAKAKKTLRQLKRRKPKGKEQKKILGRKLEALKELIPFARDRKRDLTDQLSTFKDDFAGIQGLGGPQGKLARLPRRGVLGGSIFDTQQRLFELNQKEESVTDTGGFSIDDVLGIAEASSYGVFDDRFRGMFAKGGTLGYGEWGIAGENSRPEIVTGPARIVGEDETEAMLAGAGAGGLDIDVYIGGEKINERIDVRINERDRAVASRYRAGRRN